MIFGHAENAPAAIEDGLDVGYSGAEMSWVLDSNPKLINSLVNIGSVKDKEYAMYEMDL